MLVKELWLGKGYACKISKQVFSKEKHGSSEVARRAALHCACEIIRDQRRNGVPSGTSIAQSRKIFQSQEANRLHRQPPVFAAPEM